MRKIVVNRCYGGFALSREAILLMREYGSEEAKKKVMMGETHPNGKVNDFSCDWYSLYETSRDDPILIRVVEELGEKASGYVSNLQIVEIPDDVEWEIEEYDGQEWVSEKHRTW